jgi:hypothetical protein
MDVDTVEYYTEGACGNLEVALHRLYGFLIYTVNAENLRDTIHWVVYVDGMYLDITGLHDEDSVLKEWKDMFSPSKVFLSAVPESDIENKIESELDVERRKISKIFCAARLIGRSPMVSRYPICDADMEVAKQLVAMYLD